MNNPIAAWWVYLKGHQLDLEEAARLFANFGARSVEYDENDNLYHLKSEELTQIGRETGGDSAAILEHARRLVSMINGAISLHVENHEPIEAGGITVVRVSGPHGRIVPVGIATERDRALSVRALSDGEPVERPKPPAVRLVGNGIGDVNLSHLLELLGAAPDWINLYKVHEVIRLISGGNDDAQDKRFKRTANMFRHREKKDPPPPDPMTLAEARTFIQERARAVIEVRG